MFFCLFFDKLKKSDSVFGDRLAAGRQVLALVTLVRIQVPEKWI